MKVLNNIQFLHMKGTYALWLWPAVYISYHSYETERTLSIQFSWLNFTDVLNFLSKAAYYNHPVLYSEKDYAEYLEKGEEEFLKEKLSNTKNKESMFKSFI